MRKRGFTSTTNWRHEMDLHNNFSKQIEMRSRFSQNRLSFLCVEIREDQSPLIVCVSRNFFYLFHENMLIF